MWDEDVRVEDESEKGELTLGKAQQLERGVDGGEGGDSYGGANHPHSFTPACTRQSR